MDMDFSPEDLAFQKEVRAFLDDKLNARLREGAANTPSVFTEPDITREWQAILAEKGWLATSWPVEDGGPGWTPTQKYIFEKECAIAGAPSLPILGLRLVGPVICHFGTPEQKARFLPRIISGEDYWCQGYSEPGAGSDLAAVKTRAERVGDKYVVNGSKIWTSGGHVSKFGILIARTDPDQPKHKGISYFICPTDLPGLTMTPIIDATTAHSFNQVFFDNVRIPVENLVGTEGDGWRLARVTLANERVSLSSAGSLWGEGPSADDLLELIRRGGGETDPVVRQRLSTLYSESEVLRLNRLRTLTARIAGKEPGPEASIQKAMADEHGQHVMEMAKEVVGASGMLVGSGPAGQLASSKTEGTTENRLGNQQFPEVSSIWHYGFIFSPALTLGGGTFAVQRNIIAERVLGLPREIDEQRGMSWAEARRN